MTIEALPSVHDCCAAGGSFPATTGMSLTGFFFPLLKTVFRMGGHPTIRQ